MAAPRSRGLADRIFPRPVRFAAVWLGCVCVFALYQPFADRLAGRRVLPSKEECVPAIAREVRALIEGYGGAGEQSPRPGAPAVALVPGPDHAYLRKFFDRLDALEKKGGIVRVFHTGDSSIYGDLFSGTVKRLFQGDFGDGGRGLLPAVATRSNALSDHVNLTTDGDYQFIDAYTKQPDQSELGFTGSTCVPRRASSVTAHRAPEGAAPWRTIEVYLRSPAALTGGPARYRLNLAPGGGAPVARETALLADDCGVVRFEVPATRSFSLDFAGTEGGLPYVDALNVETGRGVAYSTAVCSGYELSWLGWIPERHLSCGMKAYRPDLVVYHFGVNEASRLHNYPEYTRAVMEREMESFLARMKATLPDASFIIIGPVEFLLKQEGELVVYAEQKAVRGAQMRLGEKLGIAFYDMYSAAGGEGHMRRFVENGYAMTDYVHLSAAGSERMGTIFYNDLYNAYQTYRHREDRVRARERIDLEKKKDAVVQFNTPSYALFLLAVIMMAAAVRRFPAFRIAFLALVSYLFYASWTVWPLALLFAAAALDYACGLAITAARRRGRRGTGLLALSLAYHIGVLAAFKYYDFLAGLVNPLLGALPVRVPLLAVALPIGISFYTFEAISYIVDVWRGDIEPERNFVRLALFLGFFPHLVAGPIVRARQFLPGLERGGHFDVAWEHVARGVFLILTGLLKKMTADYLAVNFIDRVFDNPAMFGSIEAAAAVYGYGIQIYCDFSGYTDIALGSALLLGFRLPENFRRPYRAWSVTDFWRRWHISLSTWFRDYLYIGMGGNRRRASLNLAVTMFFCGLWHGAGVQFVIWGLFHGAMLIVERLTGIGRRESAHPLIRGIRVFITLHVVLFAWVIFRSASWRNFTGMLEAIAYGGLQAPNLSPVLLAPIAALYAWHLSPEGWKERLFKRWDGMAPAVQGLVAALVTLVLYHLAVADVKPFIYFQF